MNRQQITGARGASGAEAGESPAPQVKKPDSVTVKVTGQPVCEDGEHHGKDATFETTGERAAALGGLVSVVEATA